MLYYQLHVRLVRGCMLQQVQSGSVVPIRGCLLCKSYRGNYFTLPGLEMKDHRVLIRVSSSVGRDARFLWKSKTKAVPTPDSLSSALTV